jgi:hypothetical protein
MTLSPNSWLEFFSMSREGLFLEEDYKGEKKIRKRQDSFSIAGLGFQKSTSGSVHSKK